MENPFLKTLKQGHGQQRPRKANGGWSAAFGILKQFMDGIEEFTNKRVTCSATPGFTVTIGQEWRVVLSPTAKPSFSWILLRAYLPPEGFPVTLNVNDDEMTECKKGTELQKALTEYLQNPNVQESILALSSMK